MLRATILALLLSVILCAGTLETAFGFAESGLLIFVYIAIYLVFGCLFLFGIRARNSQLAWMRILVIIGITGAFLTFHWLSTIQRRESMQRGEMICLALEQFREKHGKYPLTLAQLTPEFLNMVPPTRMGVFKSHPFHYFKSTETDGYTLTFDAHFFMVCSKESLGEWKYHE